MGINFKELDKLDLEDYKEKLNEMSQADLVYEKYRLYEKMDMKFMKYTLYGWKEDVENISENPDEKNRIYLRHKMKFVIKMVNSELANRDVDYRETWKFINEMFVIGSFRPDFADKIFSNKAITFADRLTVDGMKAYKNYLLFLYDELSSSHDDAIDCVSRAVNKELEVDDGKLDRAKFYSKKVIIENPKLTKAVLREVELNKKMKQLEKESALKI